MSTIEVTPVRGDEYATWRPLAEAYQAFYGHVRGAGEYDRLWQRLRTTDVLHAAGTRVDGNLVGIVHYLFHASCWATDVCYLQDLFVDPQFRRQGLGGALINHVASHARRLGASRVYWLTQSDNATARRLYDAVAACNGFIRYEMDL